MALKSAATSTAKWLQNYQGATAAMQAGAQAVQVAPGQAAAAVAGYWLQKVQASQAKWARNVAAVTLGEWQQAYIQLGIPRGQEGAAQKQSRYTQFITDYLQFLQGAVAQVKAMPKGNIQQSIARAAAMIQASAQWGAQRTK